MAGASWQRRGGVSVARTRAECKSQSHEIVTATAGGEKRCPAPRFGYDGCAAGDLRPLPPNANRPMTPASANGRPSAPAEPARPTSNALRTEAGGGLLKASVQAGVGFAVLFAALTFGPYFWEKSQAASKASGPAPAEKAEPKPAEPPTAPAPSPAEPNPKGTATPVPGKSPTKGDIVDKLGENASKPAPAKVNPLDKKDDDIFKEINK